jgi:hypothetical protein
MSSLLGLTGAVGRVSEAVDRSGGADWLSPESRKQRCAFLGGIRRSGGIVVVGSGEGR